MTARATPEARPDRRAANLRPQGFRRRLLRQRPSALEPQKPPVTSRGDERRLTGCALDCKLGTTYDMESVGSALPAGTPQPESLRLVIFGPDRERFQLGDINANITVRELANKFWETHYPPLRIGRPVVHRDRDEYSEILPPNRTLNGSGVTDGDTLWVTVEALAGGVLELVAVFVASAIANGVLGNAAHELLKGALERVRKRIKFTKDVKLSERDVADIAVGCCCVRLRIQDPSSVEVYDVWVDGPNVGNVILDTNIGRVYAIIFPATDGDSDHIRVELRIPVPLGEPPEQG